jgi:Ca2+-binding EF-hand superfamily protein
MRFSVRFGAAMLLAISSAPSFASPEALKALDTNNSGSISLEEAQAGGAQVFVMLDPDKGGTLDATALAGRLDSTALKAADPDNDGSLDPHEYVALIEAKFKAADPDNNGSIDANELPSSNGLELLKIIHQ